MQCEMPVQQGTARPSIKRKRLQSTATTKGDRIYLNKSLIRIGVNEDLCDVVLECITEPTGMVLDVFATLSFHPAKGGAWYLNDFGTPQGIFVKGVKCERVPVLLTNNAEISFAAPFLNHGIVYRFRVEGATVKEDNVGPRITPAEGESASHRQSTKKVRSDQETHCSCDGSCTNERQVVRPVDARNPTKGVNADVMRRAYLEIVENENRDKSEVSNSAQSVKDESTESIESSSMMKELSCSICLELICQSSNLECGHSFCKCCIETWLGSKLSCPVCRSAVSSLPGSALALDKLVLSTIESNSKTKMRYEERKKASDERDGKSARRKEKLDEMLRNATSRGHKLVSISTPWSERETKRMLRGIQGYYGVARQAYCKSVCLDEDFVFSAPLSEVKTAIANVRLKPYPKFQVSETEKEEEEDSWKDASAAEIRMRLKMFIHYS